MQLHEQKLPHVENLFNFSSYLYGSCKGILSKEWQHHQHQTIKDKDLNFFK